MMVPTKEFDQLVQYYKGEITDNALLNKAGRLAAESHVILRDKSIPDSIAIKKIKPLARQRGRLTKRIRQIGPLSSNSVDVSEEEDEEEGDLVKGPLETMFHEGTQMTSTVSISSRCDFWFAVAESVIIRRLWFQSSVISLSVGIWTRLCISCDGVTSPREEVHLTAKMAPRSFIPFARIFNSDLSWEKKSGKRCLLNLFVQLSSM